MKIKLKKIPISKTLTLVIFAVMMAIAIPVRSLQLLLYIDHTTGFYVEGDTTAPILNAVLWIGLILICLILFLGKGSYSENYRRANKPLGVAAVVSGLFILIEMGTMVAEVIPDFTLGVFSLSSWLQIILLLVTAIAITSFGLRLFQGETRKDCFGLLMLIPTFWAGVSLMVTFMEHTTIANISQTLFDVLAMCFMTIFVYLFARVCMGYADAHTETMMLASGYLTAAFSLLSSLPSFLILISGDEIIKQYVETPNYAIFGMGVLSLALVIVYLTRRAERYGKMSKSVVSSGPEQGLIE